MTGDTASVADPAEGRGDRHAEASRRAILSAAAELFAAGGYNQVTIRDIAARADLSPAMVMKCGGSKRELFYQTAVIAPPPLPDVPVAKLGEALVRELLARFDSNAVEPFVRALVLRLSAPDPQSVQERFVTGYLHPLAQRLGGDRNARLRAELVVAALIGLAATIRIFETPASRSAPGDVILHYGATVQRLIDS